MAEAYLMEIALWCFSLELTDNKSTLVAGIALCRWLLPAPMLTKRYVDICHHYAAVN